MNRNSLLELAGAVGMVLTPGSSERSRRFKTLGYSCLFLMYFRANDKDVVSFQLYAGFNMDGVADAEGNPKNTDELITTWNQSYRYVKCYRRPNGLVGFEMDVLTFPDISHETMDEVWNIWTRQLIKVSSHFASGA